MITNILLIDPLDPGVGSKGQNLTFSEHGHVAYQIKGNGKSSNMQAHILSLHTSLTSGWGQRSKLFFLKVVMLHIKLIRMEYMQAYILS